MKRKFVYGVFAILLTFAITGAGNANDGALAPKPQKANFSNTYCGTMVIPALGQAFTVKFYYASGYNYLIGVYDQYGNPVTPASAMFEAVDPSQDSVISSDVFIIYFGQSYRYIGNLYVSPC